MERALRTVVTLAAGLMILGGGACVRRLEPVQRPAVNRDPVPVSTPSESGAVEALLDYPLHAGSPPLHIAYTLWAHSRDLLLPGGQGSEVSGLALLLRGSNRPEYPLPGGIVGSEHGRPYFVQGVEGFEVDRRPLLLLARLAELGVPLDDEVEDDQGRTYTVGDLVGWGQWTIDPERCREHRLEVGEMLVVFSHYLPLGASWTNRWGSAVRVEELLRVALERPVGEGACGGAHTLYGIAYALEQWRRRHPQGRLEGVWRQAAEHLEQAAARVWEAQNPDGSMTLEWAVSARVPHGPLEALHAGGHSLDWLVLYLDPAALAEEACRRLVQHLQRVGLENSRDHPGEVEIRAHAAHALARYESRYNPLTE